LTSNVLFKITPASWAAAKRRAYSSSSNLGEGFAKR
jgi:hypothetical protein